MVLFFDDQVTPKPQTRARKYIRRTIKTILVLLLLLGCSLWVLSSLGGNSNALRLGVQDYLTDTTGYLADMQTMHDMKFFPIAHISFENLTFHQPVKKESTASDEAEPAKQYPPQKTMSDFFDQGAIVARVDSMIVSMNFWDMFFERRRFRALDIKGVKVDDDIWLPEPLTVESIIAAPAAESGAITAIGTYGTHKFDAQFGVSQSKDSNGITFFEIQPETPVTASLGPLALEGLMHPALRGFSMLDIKTFTVGKTEFTGSLSFKGRAKKRSINADLKTGQTHLVADLTITPLAVTGIITIPALDIRDLAAISAAYTEIKKTLGLISQEDRISFGDRTMDIDLVIEDFVHDKGEGGKAKADIEVKPYVLNVSNITGLLMGGALSGDMIIDATGAKPFLKTQVHLRGWDYASLQSEVTGQADTHLVLTSEATNFADLEKNLKGEITTIAGKGELTRDTMLYWGGGLLNTMMPSLSSSDRLKMNCMVADFVVSGTRANAKTLFMDLSDLTVVGEGSINLSKMTLDLELTPHPKEVSVLDGGITVDVTGPVSAPRIEPDGLSVGKKIGELFLGTLNPVFFALSLTDLGLNESHPCHAYLKKP